MSEIASTMEERRRIKDCSEVISDLKHFVYSSKRIGLDATCEEPDLESELDGDSTRQCFLELWKENIPSVSRIEIPIGDLWRNRQIKTIMILMQNRKNTLFVRDLHQLLHQNIESIPLVDANQVIDIDFLKAWIGYPKISLETLRKKYGRNLVDLGKRLFRKCTKEGRRFYREVYFPTICEYAKWEANEMVYVHEVDKERPRPCRVYYHFCDSITSRLTTTSRFAFTKNVQGINLHSIPKSKRAEWIRAKQGHVLFGLDYKQAEVRMLSVLSGDKRLIKCFESDVDLYDVMGRSCGISERDVMKNIFLSFIYGSSIRTLQRRTKLSEHRIEEVKGKINKFFPEAIEYIDATIKEAKSKRYAVSPTGRIFRLEDDEEPYRLLNYVLQSTTADLNNAICARLLKGCRHSRMVLHIHDGYLFECNKAWVKDEIEHLSAIALENPLADFGLQNLHLGISTEGPSECWDF